MTISLYALLSLIPTLTNIIFAIFVYLENPRSPVNRLWSLTIACLIPWGLGEFIMRASSDFELAQFASRYGGIGFCLVPAFFFHFALAYSGRLRLARQRWFPFLIYGPALVFTVLQISELVTRMIVLPWGYARTPAAAYSSYLVWLEILFGTGLYFCYQKLRRAQTVFERKQTLFVILAVIIPLLAGSVNDAILPLLGIETVRISIFSTTITAGLIAYAIARFRLMALTPQATATSILETMGELLAVVDEKGTVQYANTPFRQLVANGKQTLASLSVHDFVPEDSVWEAMQQIQNQSHSRTLRTTYQGSPGRLLPVSVLVSGIFDKGEKIGYVLLARDISEEVRLQNELERAARQRTEDLTRYATSVQRVLEEERLRIARELHDDVCQRLSALKLQLVLFEQELPKKMTAKRKRIAALKQQIRKMIVDVRRISYNLRPTSLDDFGLVTALKLLCKDFERSHNLDIRLVANVNGALVENSQVEIALYRIAQEALSNAALHARARTVRMNLTQMEKIFRLTVEDDGIGFQVDGSVRPPSTGFGLIGMKERAELLGGKFAIESSPRKGTTINVEIPTEEV